MAIIRLYDLKNTYFEVSLMKKYFIVVFILSLILMLSSCESSSGKVVKEYDGDILFSSNEAYAIGENKDGKLIFKDTDKAFEQVVIDYADGFKAIQEQFNLSAVSKKNWEKYKTYG
jgi:hypothetical protein